ncbi:MAG TPA: hypothetical protein VGS21_01850, partial [Acidimicrobiales bacterium]|nr:hypothetical protein [Acidimicrobiales bacterium]
MRSWRRPALAVLVGFSAAVTGLSAIGHPATSAAAAVTAAADPSSAADPGSAATASSAGRPIYLSGTYYGDACMTTSDCVAVGQDDAHGALAAHWNGIGWVQSPLSLPPGTASADLAAVSCTSTTFCEAVGWHSGNSSTLDARQLVETWNGARWSLTFSGFPGSGTSIFTAVSCLSTTWCMAAGYSTAGPPGRVGAPFAARFNGSSWAEIPVTAGYPTLFASISCRAPSACLAVGVSYAHPTTPPAPPSNPLPAASTWNGTAWSMATPPIPPGYGGAYMTSVSCPAVSSCTSVGLAYPGGNLAESWNGSAWNILPTPTEPGTYADSLNAVSCPTTTSCIAVGSSAPNSLENTATLLAQSWNGRQWTTVPIPDQPGLPSSNVNALSCLSVAFCVAVGYAGDGVDPDSTTQTLEAVWTGSWAISPAVVAIVPTKDGRGYYLANSAGAVFPFGDAHFWGDMVGHHMNAPVVAMALDPATGGYWLLGRDGGVFTFHAPFYGSTGNLHLNKPVVGMESTPNGSGYRFVASDGGIFCFSAPFYGSMGNHHLNQPIVGMADDVATGGYWLVAADGGIFTFHSAFEGSTGNIHL